LLQHLQYRPKKFSVVIDEGTRIGNLLDHPSEISFHWESLYQLDLIELEQTTSPVITEAIYKCPSCWGFSDAYLRDNWVSLTTDGASVMLGKTSGVAALIKTRFPRVIIWHCANHRLELTVGDTLDTMGVDG